jgi:hypothetical protein
MKMAVFCAIIALIMEAAGTSVNFYHTTRRNIPEDNNLHSRRCKNLKSQLKQF